MTTASRDLLRPTCVLIEVSAHYDWINALTVARLRKDAPVRVVVIGEMPEADIRARYQSVMQPGDLAVTRKGVWEISDQNSADDHERIYAEARRYEAKFGFLYMRDIIGQDRRFSDFLYPDPHPLPRQPRDEKATQLQLTAYINYCYRLYEKIFEKEGIDLIITRPDSLSGATSVQVAEHLSVPHTCVHVASHGTRVWWNYGAYRGEAVLREALESRLSEPQPLKVLDTDIRHVYKAFRNYAELASARTVLKDMLRFMIIRGHMLLQDISKGRLHRRTSFYKTLRQFWLRRQAGTWLATNGIRQHADIQNAPFFLFLLPSEPEYSVHSQSREFWHAEAIIRQIAICLPSGYRLILKEHSANLGNREASFFRRMSRIPNVQWSDHRIPGTAMAKDAVAMATCAGTAAFEAALLGKPCIVFGRNVVFSFLPHIVEPRSMREMHKAVAEAARPRSADEIQKIKEYGSRAYRAIEDISFDIADTVIYGGTKRTLDPAEMERCQALLIDCFRRQLKDYAESRRPSRNEPVHLVAV